MRCRDGKNRLVAGCCCGASFTHCLFSQITSTIRRRRTFLIRTLGCWLVPTIPATAVHGAAATCLAGLSAPADPPSTLRKRPTQAPTPATS
ncbi:hypothetical protein L249_5836 [Ophiocordyceps polyrhachis-furcata BCC 54312]|uniref:Uncharacterized protein n=1 Tax=Ophiocordyceps polyrhachis-furcata BCC 54312 TaxID=1330021 RepID=A0A367L065_9HYPO|nr:hypothetical protein L249_5836 [Ophiocordyceps polyrhachis-furcata BCC 54312]